MIEQDLIEIPVTTASDYDERWDKKRGCLNLNIPVFIRADANEINLRDSIMLMGKGSNVMYKGPGYYVLTDEDIDPECLLELKRPTPELRFSFASGQSAAVDSVMAFTYKELIDIKGSSHEYMAFNLPAFYQPQSSFKRIFGDDYERVSIPRFLETNRKLGLKERAYIDLYNFDRQEIFDHMQELIMDISVAAKLKVRTNYLRKNYRSQTVCTKLINTYPFVLQHIFHHLTELNILKIGLNVLGVEYGVYAYRHNPKWFYGASLPARVGLDSDKIKIFA